MNLSTRLERALLLFYSGATMGLCMIFLAVLFRGWYRTEWELILDLVCLAGMMSISAIYMLSALGDRP